MVNIVKLVFEDISWGTHFCQFYQTKEDLIDILVPYFKAGLENDEFCMWITSNPLSKQEAKETLQKVIPNIDSYLKQGQIEIIPYNEWYTKEGNFDSERVLNGWIEKLNQALEKGYNGLRLSGNIFWLEKEDWNDFADYEESVDNVIGQHQMMALCTYPLDKCSAAEIIDVVNNHEFALIMREGKWELIESSEHKRTKEELWESKKRYQQFFDNPLNGFALCEIITDDKKEPIDFVYLEVNNAFEDFTGLKREDVINKKATDVFPPEEVAEIIKIYGNVALTGKSANFEYPLPYLSKYYEIAAFSPQKRRFIAFFTDITERKKAEEELKKVRNNLQEQVEERTSKIEEAYNAIAESEAQLKYVVDELERSNEELESFAYITSHDLQEPLRTIANYAGLINNRYKGKLDSDADEFLDYIISASKRMKEMIQSLLEYSKVGTQSPAFVKTDMNVKLEKAILNLKSAIDKSGAEITHDFLPTVNADPNQMVRVFQNLIGNAIKFKKPEFPPRIHVSTELDRNKQEWVFSVTDNGIGMEEEHTDKIFEVFKRLHAIDEYDGTGIGLAIIEKIISSHGGHVWVKSELGMGSTFYFTIPITKLDNKLQKRMDDYLK